MLFSTEGISKAYPGVQALDRVDLSVAAREVVGLVGENGAGKSTLLNIVSGVQRPDAGAMSLKGAPYAPADYRDANQAGVFRVFQETAVIPNLRVYENVFLAAEQQFRRFGVLLDRRKMLGRSRDMLADLGLDLDVSRPAGEYGVGLRQAVEIGRAVLLADLFDIEDPLILFDEPTTALDQDQHEHFLGLVDRLRARASILFVSHHLPDIVAVCDRLYVLKDGAVVQQLAADEADEARLHALMVGRERAPNYYHQDRQRAAQAGGPAALRVDGLTSDGAFEDVSLMVRAGEVLGVGGLLGSGKASLGHAISGSLPTDVGTVQIGDDPPARPSLRAHIRAGLVLVPGDRQQDGVVGDASILFNFEMASVEDRFGNPLGVINHRRARGAARDWVNRLQIATRSVAKPIGSLSGGNQQKVVLAKWLSRNPRAVILDNPTQGVDTGAREAIYEIVRSMAESGVGVLLITDDLPELIGLSDRIVVMAHGRVQAEVSASVGEKPTEEEIVTLMSADRTAVSA